MTTTTTDTELTPRQAVEKAAEYWRWLNLKRLVDGRTGEIVDEAAWKKRRDALNKDLKRYIAEHEIEAIVGEGFPDLRLQTKNEEHIDLAALLESDPDIFYAIVRLFRVADFKAARELLNPEQVTRFNLHVHNLGRGDGALAFDRRAR